MTSHFRFPEPTMPLVKYASLGILRVARKDLWKHRRTIESAFDRIREINPEVAGVFMWKFSSRLVTKLPRKLFFWAKHGFLPPMAVVVNPGDYCQLKCDYCGTDDERSRNNSVLDYETLEKVLKDMPKIGARAVYVMGGESLHEKQKHNITRAIKNFPKRFFYVYTNGIGLDQETINTALENLDAVFLLSCDGHGDVSDKTRGKGSFSYLLRGAGLLKQNKYPFYISFRVMQNNLEHVSDPETIQKFKDLGAAVLSYLPFLPVKGVYEGIMPTKKQIIELTARLHEAERITGMPIFNYSELTHVNKCRAGTKHLYVSTDGTVSPCFVIGSNIGNIREKSLEQIITTPFAKDFRAHKAKLTNECAALQDPKGIQELSESYGLRQTSDSLGTLARISDELRQGGYV